MTILSTDNDKQQIALNYLTISSRKVREARGYDQAIAAVKTLHMYIKLAKEYGCSIAEMTMALDYDRQRAESLLEQVK